MNFYEYSLVKNMNFYVISETTIFLNVVKFSFSIKQRSLGKIILLSLL